MPNVSLSTSVLEQSRESHWFTPWMPDVVPGAQGPPRRCFTGLWEEKKGGAAGQAHSGSPLLSASFLIFWCFLVLGFCLVKCVCSSRLCEDALRHPKSRGSSCSPCPQCSPAPARAGALGCCARLPALTGLVGALPGPQQWPFVELSKEM